jgi:hypothetical protein
VRDEHQPRPGRGELAECRQRLDQARVVGDRARLHRHVEVDAHEHVHAAQGRQIEILERQQIGHRQSSGRGTRRF